MARALAARTELTYIYFADDPAALRPHLTGARAVIPVTAPKKYTPIKILKGIVGALPLPVQNYTSPLMGAAIGSALESATFDLIHLDSIHLCSYLPMIQEANVVLDWHNIESELMLRYAANSRSRLRSVYARATARRMFTLEQQMLQSCSGHIVCSSRERIELLARAPEARVVVIENGVDTQHFQPAPPGTAPSRVVFVGQMSYHANADAAIWFANAIWPAVCDRFPQLGLAIAGSDPTPAVSALGQQPGIRITGTVPDVLPFYQDAFASIVPLKTGGGTRLKILEAMAAGAPVISTALGAEGLHIEPGVHFLLADETPASWLNAFDKLSNDNIRSMLTNAGRDLVCRDYDWEVIGARLADTYEAWVGSSSRRSSIQ